jgi:hypothetical protein
MSTKYFDGNSQSEQKWFSNKDINYLKKVSREATEQHTNTSALYFQVDYNNSKKNFYGELIVRKWVNPLGVEVKGIIDLVEGDEIAVEDIPNKTMKLNFSCYLDHLRELNIQPELGDCFSIKNRIYMIYNKTILDANMVSIATDQEAVYIKYDCIELVDEQLIPPGDYSSNIGSKNDITGSSQTNKTNGY